MYFKKVKLWADYIGQKGQDSWGYKDVGTQKWSQDTLSTIGGLKS